MLSHYLEPETTNSCALTSRYSNGGKQPNLRVGRQTLSIRRRTRTRRQLHRRAARPTLRRHRWLPDSQSQNHLPTPAPKHLRQGFRHRRPYLANLLAEKRRANFQSLAQRGVLRHVWLWTIQKVYRWTWPRWPENCRMSDLLALYTLIPQETPWRLWALMRQLS